MWNDLNGQYQMMGWGDGAWPWLMMSLHSLFWLLAVGLAVTALALLIHSKRRPASLPESGAPIAILKTRYAQGKIDRPAYLERKRDLS